MPNPVAANDLSPISGSLQTSRISYGVETAGKNYGQNYNGTTWYSDIPQNGSQYTIISDNYTANYYVSRSNAEGAYVEGGLPAVDDYSAPVFWVTPGISSLDVITIVNGLPDRIGQIPFNSGSQALNWIASSSNYFAVGPDYYAQIDADGLIFYVDANQVISYPTTQSTWYDLSGYNLNSSTRNVTLYNNPTWNSNGWFTFDSTDDYGLVGVIPEASSSYVSITTLVQRGTDGWNGALFGFGTAATSTQDVYFWGGEASRQFGFNTWNGDSWGFSNSTTSGNIMDGRWHHLTAIFDRNTITNSSIYVDGVLKSLSQVLGTTLTRTVSGNFGIGLNGWNTGDQLFRGNMANMQMYPKVLTAAEVAQNYYGGPIVTDGLVFAIDAGNLVSYPKSGTTVYPLTGSNTDTLTNGVGFSPIDGGIWTFDGVDDYIDLSTDPWPANAFTNDSVSIWFKFSNYGVILGQNAAPTLNVGSYVPAIYIDTSFYLRTSMFWGGSTGNQSVSPSPLSINTWYNVTLTNGSNTQKTYLNGELIATLSKTQASYAGVYYYTLGAGVWAGWGGITGSVGYLQGQIANLYYYDKELTASEVLQNYNATK